MENKLYFAKTKKDAIIPTKKDGDAGYDIYANFEEDYIVIYPHTTKLVPTGIASAMSNDYYIQIEERGSTGSKGIKSSAGVVDASYRGEIFIALTNINNKPIVISKLSEEKISNKYGSFVKNYGMIYYPYTKAIAQLVLHKLPKLEVEEISYDKLKEIPSERGDGSLGSSGK